MPRWHAGYFCFWGTALSSLFACGSPEVVVVNQTNDFVMLKDLSLNGCLWSEVLKNGDTTTVGACLPGAGRIHFKKLDVSKYCQEQAGDSTIPGLCPCNALDAGEPAHADGPNKFGLVNDLPFWFNYQTTTTVHIGYGEFHRFEIDLAGIEQDFSVSGPYGH